MKPVAKMAFSGMMGALALVFLLLTLFPFSAYAMPLLASACMIPVVVECGRRYAAALYVATALLALFIVPDLEAKCLYILFFGGYPVCRSWLGELPRPVAWLCKFAVFNGAMVLAYGLLNLLGVPLEEFIIPGVSAPLWVFLLAFLLVGNVIFLLYDRLLGRLTPVYRVVLQPWLRRIFR